MQLQPAVGHTAAIKEMIDGIYGAFYNSKASDSRELFRLDVRFDAYD